MNLNISFLKIIPIYLAIKLMTSCENLPTIMDVDLIINAKVLNEQFSSFHKAQIIISNGKIIDIVLNSDHQYKSKKVINTGWAYPGFIDGHCHFWGYAKGLNIVNLVGTASFEEVIRKVKEYQNTQTVINGRGWDQNDWVVKKFPNKRILDELYPETPVILQRIDGHAVLVNQKVLTISGITAMTKVDGGEIILENGEPTGILIDNAVDLIKTASVKLNMKQQLLTAQQNCFEVGLTTLDDAGLNWRQINYIDSLQKTGDLKIRIYAMVSDDEENYKYFLERGPIKTERLSVRSFKFYADGALGSRGACLLETYSDRHQHFGSMIHTKAHYVEKTKLLFENGFQVNTHAIGDSANRMLLQVYADVLNGAKNKRWRIEHAQVMDENDFIIFKRYGILPSVQPTHATSDMLWADERLGEERLKFAYAYKDLLQTNGILPLGTDFPVEDIDPLKTFYAAVARKDLMGRPEGGFQMENALTRVEALKGMTTWAAYANFEENEKGTIQTGMFADLVILDTDLLNCAENDILRSQVLYTIINGEIVFSQP